MSNTHPVYPTTLRTLPSSSWCTSIKVITSCWTKAHPPCLSLPHELYLPQASVLILVLPVLHCCFLTEWSTACTADTAGRYVVRLYVREPITHAHTTQLQVLVIWGWCEMELPAAPTHLVVWRSTTVDGGALCVMTIGLPQTLVWLVVNLDLLVLPVQPVIVQALLQGEIFYSLCTTA